MIGAVLLWMGLAHGQAVGQVWTDVGLDVRVTKRVTVFAESSLRVQPPRVDELNNDLGVKWKASKRFRLAGAYRLALDQFDPTRPRHRFQLDATVRLVRKPVKLDLRFRETLRLPTADSDLRFAFRPRLKLAIPTETPVTPFVASELFIVPRADRALWHKLRSSAGATFDVGAVELKAQYRNELSLGDNPNPMVHIGSVGATFTVDARKKKKKKRDEGEG